VRIAVARELAPGETRVAMVPELLSKLRAVGYEIAVQTGAGAGALFSDAAFAATGSSPPSGWSTYRASPGRNRWMS
jgi:H+-translocating NAD(P) transhydrogenase subunit alpha